MAQVYQFRPPHRRRPGLLTLDRLAGLSLALGVLVAWLLEQVPGASGLSLLLGLGAAYALYAGLYDRAR